MSLRVKASAGKRKDANSKTHKNLEKRDSQSCLMNGWKLVFPLKGRTEHFNGAITGGRANSCEKAKRWETQARSMIKLYVQFAAHPRAEYGKNVPEWHT
jgi:hypothetical protein